MDLARYLGDLGSTGLQDGDGFIKSRPARIVVLKHDVPAVPAQANGETQKSRRLQRRKAEVHAGLPIPTAFIVVGRYPLVGDGAKNAPQLSLLFALLA